MRNLLEDGGSHPDQQDMRMMALMSWAEKDAGAAWDFINTEYPGRLEFYDRQSVLSNWFDQDPDAALPEIEVALSTVTSPEEHAMLADLYTRHLTRQNPEAALQWALSLDDFMVREQTLMNLFFNQSNLSPETMISFIDQLSAEDQQKIMPMVSQAIVSNMARTDPLGAMAWAEQLPSSQRLNAQQTTISDWVNYDPDAALGWLLAQPETSETYELIRSVAYPVVYSNPEAGMVLFQTLPAQMQTEMVEPIISALSQQGQGVAQQWLSEQSNPEVVQRGSLMIDLMDPDADTYSTLENIAALESNKEEFMFRFLSERAYTDQDTVTSWISETGLLTDQEREMFQQLIVEVSGSGFGVPYGGAYGRYLPDTGR